MNKISTFLSLLVAATLQANGQALNPVSLEQKAGKATLVVEARVLKGQPFWNPAHTMIYTAWDLEVYKAFKGEAVPARVQVLTQGGFIGNEGVAASDLLRLSEGETGVFFLYPNTIDLKSPDGALLYDVSASAQGFLHYNLPRNGAYAPFAQYPDIEEDLYPALQSMKGGKRQVLKALPAVSRTAAKGTGTITGFSPARVHAGAHLDPANNTLTITGTGFGTASGSAGITFDDADDGAGGNFTALIPYNSPLVTSWSATQVVVKVPQDAGTGDFRIYDNTGALAATGTGLIVDYAVMTADFGLGDGPQEVNMMNTNGAGGYSLYYSTNTAGSGINILTSTALGTVQRALVTHRETGGVNFSDSTAGAINTTTVQAISSAQPNVIEFDNANTTLSALPDGVLGVCYSWFTRCSGAGNAVRRSGLDVLLYNAGYTGSSSTAFTNGPCAPAEGGGTSQLDLETVIFHELGHGANQNHINDQYEYSGGNYPAVNPGAVMNFNLLNGVRRNSYDNPLLGGITYSRTPKAVAFGNCAGSPFSAMSPLSTIISARDECGSAFPANVPFSGSAVSFDLIHATANKNTDPQYIAIRTSGVGTNVTNTQYYAFRTSAAGGTVNMNITAYDTRPGTACASGGVELALYAVSSCPTGQAYPAPVAYRTFNGTGAVSAFTGLAGNTTYLLMADGLENTKAAFSMVLSSPTALSVGLRDFSGKALSLQNVLDWHFSAGALPYSCLLERSADGGQFTGVHEERIIVSADGAYTDHEPLPGKNYYRLKMMDKDGSVSYSKTVVLTQSGQDRLALSPTPAHAEATLYLDAPAAGQVAAALYHTGGQLAAQWSWQAQPGANTFTLDLSAVAPGMYLLQVRTGDQTRHLKLIKQ